MGVTFFDITFLVTAFFGVAFFAGAVKQVVGYEGEIVFDATKPDGTPRKLMDVSQITGIGWKARTSLTEGLAAAIKADIDGASLVVADLSCLATLPREILTAGLAEVVKAGIIADAGLLDLLAAGIPPVGDVGAWAQLVLRAARVKARIVARDPGERGQQRIHLNLGHTFAHGLEQASGFRLAHGQAVALGLVAAARLAERLGLLQDAGLPDRLIRLQRALGLPTCLRDIGLSLDGAAILAAMGRDKKASQGRLRLVLPRGLEALTVVDGVPADDVAAVLALL